MKAKLSFTLLAFATVSLNLHAATAVTPAPLPGLMDQQQLAQWNASQQATAKTAASAQEVSPQFYTGKPYVSDAGGYIFKYRTYNPEMSCWTSADPSGYPDGPNAHFYAPVSVSQLDSDGFAAVSVAHDPTGSVDAGGGTDPLSAHIIPPGAQKDPGGAISATMDTQWVIADTSLSGYIIQHISYTLTQYNNSDNSVVQNTTQSWYEVWTVNAAIPAGTIGGMPVPATPQFITNNGVDNFTTGTPFSSDTHGSFVVTGTAEFFQSSAFTGATLNNNPANWGTNAPGTHSGALPSTTTAPHVWASNTPSLDHEFSFTWSE